MAAGDAPGLKGALFRRAVAAKLERLHTTGDPTHAFWDKLVFRKVRIFCFLFLLGACIMVVVDQSFLIWLCACIWCRFKLS